MQSILPKPVPAPIGRSSEISSGRGSKRGEPGCVSAPSPFNDDRKGRGGKIQETKTPLGSSYQQRPSIGLFQERVRPMLPSHSVALPRRIFSVSPCLRVSPSPCLLVSLSFALAAWMTGPAYSHGLLIPEDRKVPPLAMVNHQVTISIDDQVAETRVEQTFRNHTAR